MINIIGKKYWYFLFSLIIIIPGIFSLFKYGLNLSIEFTGGSTINYTFSKALTNDQISKIKTIFTQNKIKIINLENSGTDLTIKSQPVDQKQDVLINNQIQKSVGNFKKRALWSYCCINFNSFVYNLVV